MTRQKPGAERQSPSLLKDSKEVKEVKGFSQTQTVYVLHCIIVLILRHSLYSVMFILQQILIDIKMM